MKNLNFQYEFSFNCDVLAFFINIFPIIHLIIIKNYYFVIFRPIIIFNFTNFNFIISGLKYLYLISNFLLINFNLPKKFSVIQFKTKPSLPINLKYFFINFIQFLKNLIIFIKINPINYFIKSAINYFQLLNLILIVINLLCIYFFLHFFN